VMCVCLGKTYSALCGELKITFALVMAVRAGAQQQGCGVLA